MRIGLVVLASWLVACGGHTQSSSTCGDGKVDPGEDCDGGSNCTADCTFACVAAATDCPAAPACQVASCTTDHACQAVTDPTQNGLPCGDGHGCSNGTCVATMCGDGVLQPGEQCDFGADNGMGFGCEATCVFSCTLTPNSCDDGDPCNGVETCTTAVHGDQAGQLCVPGQGATDGTTCGTGKLCLNQTCTAASCGDGFVTAPEECDDANAVAGDGCENDCRFTCVSTDTARNCTPADACAGQGTCNDSTHECAPGTPLMDNTACGIGGFCKAAVCTQPVCGNGIPEPGEACDDGALNGTAGDGCKSTCQFACVNPATDCPMAPACEKETCTALHVCQAVADATQNNMTCGTGLTCSNGACIGGGATCGNGIVEAGEQCDFGVGNGPGTGCESTCQFSCTILPNSCDDGNPCNGLETCGGVTVSGHAGQKCTAGTPEANGTACGTGKICLTQLCKTSACGDGFIDASAGESCEPPSTMTCDGSCHTILCGDGIRAGTEQCDDHNTTNLDGCDASCKFEQVQRVNTMAVAFAADAYCPKDALGAAVVGGIAQNQITSAITTGIGDGSITIIMDALALDDLSGTSDPSLSIGVLGGSPATSSAPYNGSTSLDWWYPTDPTTIDATRTAKTKMPASIAAKVLNAGPTEISITVTFVGVAVTMDLFGTTIRATIGASSAPLASTGMAPGHLATESLDPALTSFASMTGGELCGNTTAQSLQSVLVPSVLVGSACNNFYTTSNTLLDLYVGGCTALILPQVKATQPDTSRDGATYKFTTNAAHQVTGCTRNAVASTLATCLANAAYTSLFKFTTDRVISK